MMTLKHICSQRAVNLLFVLISCLVLSSCITLEGSSRVAGSTDRLMEKAQAAMSLKPPKRETRLLNIAETLVKKGQSQPASTVIASIDANTINNTQFAQFSYVKALINQDQQKYLEALGLLNSKRMNGLWKSFSLRQQKDILGLRASLNSQLGNIEASVAQRTVLDTLLLPGSKSAKANEEARWKDLLRLPEKRLMAIANDTSDTVLKGWYELAAIHKRYEADPKTQAIAMQRWAASNQRHPASRNIAIDERFTLEVDINAPQKIALLLPLEGELSSAGRAIRDGFLASHDRASSSGQATPTISTYDTNRGSIETIYNRAVADGADMIIGPLTKERVLAISQLPELPVVTLTLNYLANGTNLALEPHPRLFQFGLSPEDEGRQIAERAWQEGHRSALILRRKSDWSPRAANAFTRQWQAFGGEVVEEVEYNNANLAQTVKQALKFNRYRSGRASYRTLSSGRKVRVEPRRRNDMDFLVMMASPNEGRQISPALAFYYAKGLPVYSTRHIYAGMKKDERDEDLENIRFTTLPWLFDNQYPEKRTITGNSNIPKHYHPLYALGIDAFLLQDSLGQLSQKPVQGLTGRLSLETGQRIARTSAWAYFDKGKVKALPAASSRFSDRAPR